MNQSELQAANGDLGQTGKSSSKIILYIIIGIVIGVLALIVLGILAFVAFVFVSQSTYPFIPTPRNTLRSKSPSEFLLFLVMDAAESQEEYGVISRKQILEW